MRLSPSNTQILFKQMICKNSTILWKLYLPKYKKLLQYNLEPSCTMVIFKEDI